MGRIRAATRLSADNDSVYTIPRLARTNFSKKVFSVTHNHYIKVTHSHSKSMDTTK